MNADQVRRFTYDGFGYRCRIVENPAPLTEPIVVVGGAFQDMHAFRRLEGPWAASSTLINVELPGSGAADALPASHGFEFLSDVLIHLLDGLGLARANLFGASYGAPVVYGVAQERPERVARMALFGVAPRYPDAGLRALRALVDALEAGDTEAYARLIVAALVPPADRRIRNRPSVTKLLTLVMGAVTPDEIPRHIASTLRLIEWKGLRPGGIGGVPALCFTGEHDPLTCPGLGREAAATIEGAVFTMIREAGHLPVLERPREFADLVARFFTDRPLHDLPYTTPLERQPLPAGTGAL
ncbi:alpha/beta fold hydrolase [Streptomyces genisteinicus]|uniref:Alpha/beta fold hydrolase n=1 Tax=Streptomyces genisteinicus TaxID=2768068 RepID=A0A7H0HTM2_9ACTN|nr:alpha/beta hydrolase [Streptomyces genisteinicus]QNP63888.1 alpha/beta fold hydrolase [Streptomyces genisteinicus]